MYARAIEDAATRIRELRLEEWGDFGLGSLMLGLAAASAEFRPAFALPLLVGGLAAWALGIRAMWRRWDLVDRLSGERDAHLISEVRDHALRGTTMERRNRLAAAVRRALEESRVAREERVLAAANELEALAIELEDEELVLEPACAVACVRLLSDIAASPLLDRRQPTAVLRSRVAQIRAGFSPRRLAA
jgi:hypothetical protein